MRKIPRRITALNERDVSDYEHKAVFLHRNHNCVVRRGVGRNATYKWIMCEEWRKVYFATAQEQNVSWRWPNVLLRESCTYSDSLENVTAMLEARTKYSKNMKGKRFGLPCWRTKEHQMEIELVRTPQYFKGAESQNFHLRINECKFTKLRWKSKS